MKTAAIGMVGLLMLTVGVSAEKVSKFSVRNDEIFTGEIMDSFCAEDGHHTGVTKSEKILLRRAAPSRASSWPADNSSSTTLRLNAFTSWMINGNPKLLPVKR